MLPTELLTALTSLARSTPPSATTVPDGPTSPSQPGTSDLFPTLRGFGHGWQGQHNSDLAKAGMVRRLTPVECERLHGLAGWLDDRGGVAATLNSGGNDGGFRTEPGEHLALGGGMSDDPLLPLGLDSHRYRCCGNGVVAPVAEWLGQRLAEALA
jgi:site-specific DNA-cytosine methylase